jgi:myo-inositol 2-dehydrogenase/D-chiro-inositol 1-dehydrogenase
MSAAPEFRLALAGAGRMGRNHLRALTGNPRVGVTHVVEPVAAVRDRLAAEGLRVYPSVEDLPGGEVDGVLVAAPTGFHGAVVAAATKAGLPVLCEKPAGLNPAAVREAGDAAAAAGVAFQVAYWRRFVPALRQLRERLAAGEFGEVLFAAATQWDGAPPAAQFRAGSGGIFVDMGVHEFDELRWLTGQEITTVAAVAAGVVTDAEVRERGDDVDSAQALLGFSGGATGLVSLGRHFPGGDMAAVEVFGTRGHERILFLDPADGDAAMDDALARQAEAFADLVAAGDSAEGRGAGVQDAVAALEAATRAGGPFTI